MINGLKTLTVNIVAGANVATVLLLILAGYADHINPDRFPMLSSMGMTFPVFLIANLLQVEEALDSHPWLCHRLSSVDGLYAHPQGAAGAR